MSPAPPSRTIVLRASRDTLVLLAAATGLTFAIAHAVHNRPSPAAPTPDERAAAGQWTGQLAALQPGTPDVAPIEPLSSAALTIPKTAMALPAPPRPATPGKARPCDGEACQPSRPALAAPAHRAPPRSRVTQEASLVERLNPFNHLPELVRRPFASASDTIAGWVRRF